LEPSASCVSGVEVREGRTPEGTRPGDDSGLPFEKLGHYEIVSRLGQGGMGDVYLGYERSLDRRVAIKVLPSQFARDPDLVRRFRAEATAAARLVHPNIIQIYYIGEDSGHHFFAMQFVDGMSLARLLSQHPRLTIDESLAIIDEVLSGLVAAHRQGFVHRDIKPGNILIDREHRRALLADFGLVKSLEDSAAARTSMGTVLGTADYIAPEQGLGKTVDCRSDLYSTGVVLYQLLCGRLPFIASESTAVIYQHVHEPPPLLGEVAPEVPAALATIVDKLLAKLPEDRYQTAADALADVRAVRTGHSELVLPASLTAETKNGTRSTRSSTPGLIETATEALTPTHLGRPAGPGRQGADHRDRGRRRALLGLAAAALPAVIGGAWFAVTPADERSRWLSRLTGKTERETGQIRQFGGHPSEINCFVLTPDQELLIAGDRTGKLHIWDFAVGELRKSIRAHSGPIRRVIVTEDGKFVITCSADQTLKMWNIKTWKQATQFNGHVDVVSSVVQIPGRYEILSSSFDGTLIRWQMSLGNQLTRYGSIIHGDDGPDFQDIDFNRVDRHLAWVRDVVIPAPGNRFVSAGNDGVLLVWDLDSGEVVDRLIGKAGVIMCLAVSPDGARVLAGGYKKVICLWDLEERRLIRRLPHDSATPACVAFSPDGRHALSGGADGVIAVWDVESGERLHTLEGHDGTVTSVRFMTDGRRIISGGEDRTIRLWKLPRPAAG
jgi:serine/threonine protein kinase/WD40 repeat protein